LVLSVDPIHNLTVIFHDILVGSRVKPSGKNFLGPLGKIVVPALQLPFNPINTAEQTIAGENRAFSFVLGFTPELRSFTINLK